VFFVVSEYLRESRSRRLLCCWWTGRSRPGSADHCVQSGLQHACWPVYSSTERGRPGALHQWTWHLVTHPRTGKHLTCIDRSSSVHMHLLCHLVWRSVFCWSVILHKCGLFLPRLQVAVV